MFLLVFFRASGKYGLYLHPQYNVTVKMQNCHKECQRGNSGNVRTTDWVEAWWKWEKGKFKLELGPMKVSSTRATREGGWPLMCGCAWGFVFENTPKWGEGFRVAQCSPSPSILTARTLDFASDSGFIFFSSSSPRQKDKKHFHMCCYCALWGGEARRLIFHTNCVLNLVSLDELRAAWNRLKFPDMSLSKLEEQNVLQSLSFWEAWV